MGCDSAQQSCKSLSSTRTNTNTKLTPARTHTQTLAYNLRTPSGGEQPGDLRPRRAKYDKRTGEAGLATIMFAPGGDVHAEAHEKNTGPLLSFSFCSSRSQKNAKARSARITKKRPLLPFFLRFALSHSQQGAKVVRRLSPRHVPGVKHRRPEPCVHPHPRVKRQPEPHVVARGVVQPCQKTRQHHHRPP